MNDISETIHRALYGASDKANAPENQGEEFRAGYAFGSECPHTIDAISDEYKRRGEPAFESRAFEFFREWKRVYWAAQMQRAVLKARYGTR